MPQFILNANDARVMPHPYNNLSDFAKAYVEAAFFTNGDSGDEDEHSLNNLGVDALAPETVARIARDCRRFRRRARALLRLAYPRDYDATQAGRDFWFTRNRHGVGFWDRCELREAALGDRLSAVARRSGESSLYIGDDERIYV